MKPLFAVGDKVLHIRKEKAGTVTAVYPGTPILYYVRHSGYIWSIPEHALDSANAKNRTQQDQVVAEGNFSNRSVLRKSSRG